MRSRRKSVERRRARSPRLAGPPRQGSARRRCAAGSGTFCISASSTPSRATAPRPERSSRAAQPRASREKAPSRNSRGFDNESFRARFQSPHRPKAYPRILEKERESLRALSDAYVGVARFSRYWTVALPFDAVKSHQQVAGLDAAPFRAHSASRRRYRELRDSSRVVQSADCTTPLPGVTLSRIVAGPGGLTSLWRGYLAVVPGPRPSVAARTTPPLSLSFCAPLTQQPYIREGHTSRYGICVRHERRVHRCCAQLL